MAVLKNNPVGFLSGRIGDNVCRNRYGKTIFCHRPGPYNYNPENQKNTIAPKNKFGYSSWFATFINTIPELKEIWNKANVKGWDAYHKMMSFNISNSDITQLTRKNVISPPGLILEVKEAVLTGDSINAHLEIRDGVLSAPLKAIVVVYSFNPEKERSSDYELFAVIQEISESTDWMNFDLIFYPEQKCINVMNSHRKWIIYFTLVKDDDPSSIVWTSTASVEGENENVIKNGDDSERTDTTDGKFCYPCEFSFI